MTKLKPNINKQSSQKYAILAFLEEGNTITPLEALTKFGSLRLGARIYELKAEGYKIKTTMVATIGKSVVAQYQLESFQSGLN